MRSRTHLNVLILVCYVVASVYGFQPALREHSSASLHAPITESSRMDFLRSIMTTVVSTTVAVLPPPFIMSIPLASARGRATLERAFERYGPRVRDGRTFYATELRQIIAKSDWNGLKNALAEPPSRQQIDLQKPDSGVAERARQAGGFSDARVLTAADLLAAAFSDNSITTKTKKMQASVAKMRNVVLELNSIARQGLGEESTGGFFGIGAKKADPVALTKKARELYVAGGNAFNEYLAAANEDLALQFDRFEYLK
jgi:hypothetical protein